MATATYFLKFSDAEERTIDILGSSKDAKHPGWIEIASFAWGTSGGRVDPRSGRIGNGDKGSGAREAHCATEDGTGAIGIGRSRATGTLHPTVVLEMSTNGAVTSKTVFHDVVVATFQMSGAGGRPTYAFCLDAMNAETTTFSHAPAPEGPPVTLRAFPPAPARRGGGNITGGKASSHPRHGR